MRQHWISCLPLQVVPTLRAFNCLLPTFVGTVPFSWYEPGLESALLLPLRCELVAITPVANGEASEIRRAKGRRLCVAGSNDRYAENIGLNLHQEIVARGATVDS